MLTGREVEVRGREGEGVFLEAFECLCCCRDCTKASGGAVMSVTPDHAKKDSSGFARAF